MQPEVKTDPVLATAGSAVATEQKDIEAHFYFPCASISFLSVLGQTYKWTMTINPSRIFQLNTDALWYISGTIASLILVINQILPTTFSDIPHQLLLSRYHLYVQALIIQELVD